jgi:hypothetical protein
VLVGLGLAITCLGALAAPARAQTADVSIALTDGVTDVTAGSIVTYTATVTNTGATPVAGTLVVTVPAFATYGNVGDGTVAEHDVSWPVTIAPGAAVTKPVTVSLGTFPDGEQYLTTLASFYVGPVTTTPTVRTADADRLPGAKGPATGEVVPTPPTPAAKHKSSVSALAVVLIVVGAVAVVAGLTGIVAWILRRRRRKRADVTVAPDDPEAPPRRRQLKSASRE